LGDMAERIIKSLSHPYSVDGSRCIIGASVGVAVSPFDGQSSEDLIRNADLALYAAKGGGRGRFRFSKMIYATRWARARSGWLTSRWSMQKPIS
jgi:predicted signal transduction protein with EAL and GGDEF domain